MEIGILITGHQAFFTENALKKIAEITLSNIADFEQGRPCLNVINSERMIVAKGAA